MPYYCKNCGAAVIGKFCSCCGTRVRSEIRDFRLELSRRKRAFVNEKCVNAGFGIAFSRIATFSWEQMEYRTFHEMAMRCGDDAVVIARAYSMIPEMYGKADQFYRDILQSYCSI